MGQSTKRKRKGKARNVILALASKTNPGIFKTKVKPSKKGKGRKNNPRQKSWNPDGDCYLC